MLSVNVYANHRYFRPYVCNHEIFLGRPGDNFQTYFWCQKHVYPTSDQVVFVPKPNNLPELILAMYIYGKLKISSN